MGEEDSCEVPEAMLGCWIPTQNHVMVSGPPLLRPFAVDTLQTPGPQGCTQSGRDTTYDRDSRVICCQPAEFEEDQR